VEQLVDHGVEEVQRVVVGEPRQVARVEAQGVGVPAVLPQHPAGGRQLAGAQVPRNAQVGQGLADDIKGQVDVALSHRMRFG
jgi:hypothetical protein